MSKPRTPINFYWQTFDPAEPGTARVLADLKSGLGQAPGDAPPLWPYHRVPVGTGVTEYGRSSPMLAAEHAALTLFALHQQSQPSRMHKIGVNFGAAMLGLRNHPSVNAAALDRHMRATVAAEDTEELTEHLRSHVHRCNNIGQPLDYTRLFWDLFGWNREDQRARSRRMWAAAYHQWPTDQATATQQEAAA